MIKLFFAAAAAGVVSGAASADRYNASFGAPPWEPQAKACVAQIERHYPTMGVWIYQAAACTARDYPSTQSRTLAEIETCANRVYHETYNLCQLCGPDRIDAVMNCLGAR
jgi:hypothetical protein